MIPKFVNHNCKNYAQTQTVIYPKASTVALSSTIESILKTLMHSSANPFGSTLGANIYVNVKGI